MRRLIFETAIQVHLCFHYDQCKIINKVRLPKMHAYTDFIFAGHVCNRIWFCVRIIVSRIDMKFSSICYCFDHALLIGDFRSTSILNKVHNFAVCLLFAFIYMYYFAI